MQISFFTLRHFIAPLSLGTLFKPDPSFQVPDTVTGSLTLDEGLAQWKLERTILQCWVFVK